MEVMHRCLDLRVIVSVEFIDNFGGGGGEGLAAVGGYQCGVKGAAVEMPTFSRNNRIG